MQGLREGWSRSTRRVAMACAVTIAGTTVAVASDAGATIAVITSWSGGTDEFAGPVGIVADSNGTVWVSDQEGLADRLVKITTDATVLGAIGSWGSAHTPGVFNSPAGLAVDSADNLYVADSNNGQVQKVAPDGTFQSVFRSLPSSGNLSYPYDVAVTSNDDVLVSDSSGRIYRFDSDGNYISRINGAGSGDGSFGQPIAIATDASDNVYVADATNRRIVVFDDAGAFVRNIGGPGSDPGQFSDTFSPTIAPDGTLWVVETENNRIERFTTDGTYLGVIGGPGTDPGQFNGPRSLTFDDTGAAWVTEYTNKRVQKLDDAVAPTVTVTAPVEGAVVKIGGQIRADYACVDDADSFGMAACAGNVADGALVDTSTAGSKTFTVTGRDVFGNVTTEVRHYTVVRGRPDGRIRKGSLGAFIGDNVYSTGRRQTVKGSTGVGHAITYLITVQNDAPYAERLRVQAQRGANGYAMAYTRAVEGTAMPKSLYGTGFLTPTLAPNAIFQMKVVVTVTNKAAAGSSITRPVKVTSVADPTRSDTVVMVASRS